MWGFLCLNLIYFTVSLADGLGWSVFSLTGELEEQPQVMLGLTSYVRKLREHIPFLEKRQKQMF